MSTESSLPTVLGRRHFVAVALLGFSVGVIIGMAIMGLSGRFDAASHRRMAAPTAPAAPIDRTVDRPTAAARVMPTDGTAMPRVRSSIRVTAPLADSSTFVDCLPPIPPALATPLGAVPIRWVKDLMTDDSVPVPAYGLFAPSQRVISLRAGMSRVTAWVTLFHEEFHEIQFEGTIDDMPEPVADKIADVVAMRRVWQLQAAVRQAFERAGKPGGADCPPA